MRIEVAGCVQGHYISLVQHESKWYQCNDQHVTSFDEDFDQVCFGGEEVRAIQTNLRSVLRNFLC